MKSWAFLKKQKKKDGKKLCSPVPHPDRAKVALGERGGARCPFPSRRSLYRISHQIHFFRGSRQIHGYSQLVHAPSFLTGRPILWSFEISVFQEGLHFGNLPNRLFLYLFIWFSVFTLFFSVFFVFPFLFFFSFC